MLAAARNGEARGHQPLLRHTALAASAFAFAAAAIMNTVSRHAVGVCVHADTGRAPAQYDLVVKGYRAAPRADAARPTCHGGPPRRLAQRRARHGRPVPPPLRIRLAQQRAQPLPAQSGLG